MKRLMVLLVPSLLLLTGCFSLNPNDYTLPGQVALGSDGYTVTAEFADMQDVVPNSTVQRDDVVIGTVTSISVTDWTARVTMRLLRSVPLPANTTFRIGQKTLLGAQYIEADAPAIPRGRLGNGDSIPLEATGAYPQTEQVLAGVALLLNNGGLSQISTITGELNKALAGRIPDTRTLVARLNSLLTTLDSHKADLIHLIDLANSLTSRVAGQSQRVARAVKSIAPGLSELAAQRDALVKAVTDLGLVSTSAEKVVSTSRAALLDNLRNLRPVLKALANSGSNVTNSLKLLITVPFSAETTMNAVRGDYMNMFATFDVSIPTLASAFLGSAPASPAFQSSNPLVAPIGGPSSSGRSTSAHGSPQQQPGHPTSSPAPAPTPSPTGAPCPLLQSLLGGC